mgnify:CR=1 FL=1
MDTLNSITIGVNISLLRIPVKMSNIIPGSGGIE